MDSLENVTRIMQEENLLNCHEKSLCYYQLVIRDLLIQQRDLVLLFDLLNARMMVLSQIAKAQFDGSKEAAKKRLQKLKRAGYVAGRQGRVIDPTKLYLTGKGFNLLQERGILARYPHLSLKAFKRRIRVSEFTERHELAVMDVKVAFVMSLRPSLAVIEFSTWPKLHQFTVSHPRTRQGKTIAADGFIHVTRDESHHYFYLEVDRGTESLNVLLDKALGYAAHKSAANMGAARTNSTQHPFRVLMVVKSKERQENIARHLLESSIFSLVWIAVMEDVLNDPFGEIWIRPMDMRQNLLGVTSTTPTETNDRFHRREAVTETPVPKHRLFENN